MAYTARISLVDEHGQRKTVLFPLWISPVFFPPFAMAGEARSKAIALALALDAVTDAQVVGFDVVVDDMYQDYSVLLKASPGEQSLSEGAQMQLFKQSGKLHPYWLPAAKSGVFLPGFSVVDVSDTELQAFFTEFNNGSTGVHISDGELIDPGAGTGGVLSGYYSTRQGTAGK